MLKIKEFEAKTETEALEKATSDCHCQQEDLFYETTFEEGKLFKGSKYKLKVVTRDDLNEYLLDFCKELGNKMGFPITAELQYLETTVTVRLNSEQNAILIGKEGRTLNAIQIVLRQSLHNLINTSLKIVVDVGNYKEKKLKKLEHEIKSLAKEVSATGMEIALDPMNSYERRFVHSIVADIEGVTTESIGEGKERHIIIKKVEE